jgi:hypothetical protein
MLGYQFGLKGQPLRGLIALLTLMWTAVIIDILDLGSARLGNLRTDPAVYEWTIQSFGSGASTMSPTRPR